MSIELPGRVPGTQLLGTAALIEYYELECPIPRRLMAVGTVGRKTAIQRDGIEWTLLPRSASYRIPSNPIDHLGVALKHEQLDLRLLSCLFNKVTPSVFQAFVADSPGGIYTRKSWFLYEWMTGRQLDLQDIYGVQYVPLLDPAQYIGRIPANRSPRHKILNNLPGVPGFCPLIRRTERLREDRIAGLSAEARQVVNAADPAVLRRAIGFMLLSESKGSFGIEGETPPRTRLERWGHLIASAKDLDLDLASVEKLHRSLFDPKENRFVKYGIRRDDGFVGRHDPRDQTPLPDHISARPGDLPSLLNALFSTFALLKQSAYDPILTAALIGFGFVFIHPFEDGNGRLHRFMIQKALVDMGFNPDGVVLPISAAILEDLPGYRAALEDYSLSTLPSIIWEASRDGNVQVTNDTAYLYRYFDATRQAEYLVDRIERTIRFSLPAELNYLHRFDDAKRRLADIVDMPDRLVSLFIQFCAHNAGRLSRRKREEYFAALSDEQLAAMENAVAASGIGELH